ncbi:SCO1860 family LAETG-anchored protein, partial [Streptomyces albireticuli]
MFSTTVIPSFGMPVRRRAVRLAVAATALTAVATGTAAGPAAATGGTGTTAGSATRGDDTSVSGTSGAVVLRAGLDIGLLDKTVRVPLDTSLNEVKAPANADRNALAVTLDGVEQGRPVSVLRADTATARATADGRKAEGYANLVHAKVRLPGLPQLSLVEVQQVTSRAVCEAGRRPTAKANVLGGLSVLGKRVTLTATGPTKVSVPGVGEVRLDLSRTATTSRTAAAAALELKVSVNPLRLNVAEVEGQVTLARATCETPSGAARTPSPATPPATPGGGAKPQTAAHVPAKAVPAKATGADLAETGGGSATPYVAGAAAVPYLLGVVMFAMGLT